MLHVSGASLRLLLATVAGTCLLLLGAASAHASTYTDLQDADPGDQFTLGEGVTLVVGTASTEGDTTTIADASLDFDGGVAGADVTGVVADGRLTLTGGDFEVPKSLSTKVHTIDTEQPFVATFEGGEITDFTGEIVSTEREVGTGIDVQGFVSQGDVGDDEVEPALPAVPAGYKFRVSLGWSGCCGNPVANRNSWRVEVFVYKPGVPGETRVLNGRIYGNEGYRYWFDFSYPTSIKGQPVTIAGRLEGSNIFQPAAITGLGGSITGEIELVNGVYFTGGSVSWDKSGFKLSGGARVDCAEGSVSGQLAGAYVDAGDWSLSLTGGTNDGCLVSTDLDLPSGDLTGEIAAVDGEVSGLFEVGGMLSTPLLPDGVDEWDARFRFFYNHPAYGSSVQFYASAGPGGIGTAQGTVNFDGTFALNADFTIPFGGSSVAFDGDIRRETPGGAVTYDVGGSANISFGQGKGGLAGSLRLTNSALSFSGDLTLACPVSGSVTGGVATSLPLDGGNDWSVGLAGAAGSTGCQVTKEFGLTAGSGVSGTVKSVGGVVSVAADANATITTTLIPTKTSFTAGFKFAASQGDYSVAVNGSTQGAGFAANVASDGTFGLSFNLDDLALGGVTLGAKGTITRATPGAAVTYSISGSLAGQAKLYENLYLLGGSLSIDSTGGLKFSGTVRQKCTTGYLDATASGAIVDSRNWAFDAKGLASSCTIGRAALFNGTTFYAQIKSENAKVLYNAGVSASRINLFSTSFLLLGRTSTWLTNVTGSISNTCSGCLDGNKTRLSFSARGNAKFTFLFIPRDVAATVSGSVDIMGNSVRKVSLGISNIDFGWLPTTTELALIGALECDTEKGFTTA